MCPKAPRGKRLQGAVAARLRARRRTAVLQVPGNAADAVPCERLLRQGKPGSLGKETVDATLKFEIETQWV